MSKSPEFWLKLPLRSIVPIGDFYVVHCQYHERCGIWRTLETLTYYNFEFADKFIGNYLKSHNRFYRCLVYHFSSPAIVAGYEVTVNH